MIIQVRTFDCFLLNVLRLLESAWRKSDTGCYLKEAATSFYSDPENWSHWRKGFFFSSLLHVWFGLPIDKVKSVDGDTPD